MVTGFVLDVRPPLVVSRQRGELIRQQGWRRNGGAALRCDLRIDVMLAASLLQQ
jgi:hypothetical protein